MTSNKSQQSRSSRPYIEDNNNVHSQPPPQTQPLIINNNINNNKRPSTSTSLSSKQIKEINSNLPILLFLNLPHPINEDDLYIKYQKYYGMPLEINHKQLNDTINCHEFIAKYENTLSAQYNDDNQWHTNKEYIICIENVDNFLKTLKRDKLYEILREKLFNHMNNLHPEGIKKDELHKIFKYWFSMDFDKLDKKIKSDIINGIFNQHKLNNDPDNSIYLQLKNKNSPKYPLKEPWKV